jgi:hypothetical protein
MHRLIKTAVAGSVLVGGVISGGAAGAATPVSGPTQLWATIGNGNKPFKALFTGVIGDHGLAYSATSSGKITKKGSGYKLFVLKHGSVLVNSKTLNAALNNNNAPPTTENGTTCSATFVVTEPVTIVKGTKTYTGITGTLNVTVSFAELGPKNKNGTCNQSNSAQPVATYGSVAASGTVSYG